MTNVELAGRLRALAEVYEGNPDVPQPLDFSYRGGMYVGCHTPAQVKAALRAFGLGTQTPQEQGIKFLPALFPEVAVHVHPSACEVAARTEWRCGALLGGVDEAA